jgi:hypothetical protein
MSRRKKKVKNMEHALVFSSFGEQLKEEIEKADRNSNKKVVRIWTEPPELNRKFDSEVPETLEQLKLLSASRKKTSERRSI